MYVEVGAHRYAVIVVDRLTDHDGRELLAQADYFGQVIRISARAPKASRLTLLGHELSHVFDWEFGPPESDEGRADRVGHVAAIVSRLGSTLSPRDGRN